MNKDVIDEYLRGVSLNKLAKKNKCAYGKVKRYLILNDIELRDRSTACKMDKVLFPQHHSDDTKQKLSIIRKKYLKENPDKVPYLLNHSSRESYPENRFRTILEHIGLVGWIQHYQHSIYQYDFAFPTIKLDVEIDGATHNQQSVINKDIERDQFSRDNGWEVLRFTASEFNHDAGKCIDKLINQITKLDFNYDPYDIKSWNELKVRLYTRVLHKKICPICDCGFKHRDKRTTYCSDICYRESISRRMMKVINRPSIMQLTEDLTDNSFVWVGNKYNVSDNTIRKWIRGYGVDPKTIKHN